jgi:histone-lysine N-methyltransferase SETMAR
MVLVFFDTKGVIYTNFVPKSETVNASYIRTALTRFLKIFREKRPIMTAQDWWLHWDNTPVHTATTVVDFLAAKGVKMVPHPPYSPDLTPVEFFLFPKVKAKLAGQTLTQETFKNSCEGVGSIAKEDFAAAFRRWKERCEECICVGGNYVEK